MLLHSEGASATLQGEGEGVGACYTLTLPEGVDQPHPLFQSSDPGYHHDRICQTP